MIHPTGLYHSGQQCLRFLRPLSCSCLMALAGVLLSGFTQAGPLTVPVWSYYRNPPFVTGDHTGLSYDYVALLNTYAAPDIRFDLELLPRKRVDQKVAARKEGIVLFVNGIWMGDTQHRKYGWSDALLEDSNILVFHRGSLKDLSEGLDPLNGLVFGGVLGRKYKDLDRLANNGQLTRIDAGSEEQNLQKLIHRRIDFTTMAESVYLFMRSRMSAREELVASPYRLFRFTRHLMFPGETSDLYQQVDPIVKRVSASFEWQQLKQKYVGFSESGLMNQTDQKQGTPER